MMISEALKLEPDHYKSLTSMAKIYLKQNEIDKAEDYLKKSLKINPRYYETCSILAKIHMDKENYKDSEYYSVKLIKQRQISLNII